MAAAELDLAAAGDEELRVLLETFLLEKALSKLRYEMNNRPEWAHIAVNGILRALEGLGTETS